MARYGRGGTVYASGASAELIVNGRSYGRKKTKAYKAIFPKVIYQPGTVTAISYDGNGMEIARETLQTADGATELCLRPDRTVLRADGQDLCYLEIDLTGRDGITKSSEDVPITVAVSGAGSLLALGSAKPNMGESFTEKTHTTYYGKALAVIRAGDRAGKIQIKVNAPGMAEQCVELQTE